MDPIKAEFLINFAPVIGVVGITAILGWVFTTWLKVRHGYPLENGWGKPLMPARMPESDKMLRALNDENRALRTEMGELKNRVAVLERIATDPAARLDREIASLGASNLN